jgi:hypothetical protein
VIPRPRPSRRPPPASRRGRRPSLVAVAGVLVLLAACGQLEPVDPIVDPPTPPPTTGETPSVTGSVPADGATGVFLDTMVTTTLHLPNPGAGVDAESLSTESVRLFRTSDETPVPGGVATSGGRDSIVYQPFDDLEPTTTYTFEVTSSVRDESGAAFAPYRITFTTGTSREAVPIGDVSFERVEVYTNGSPVSTLVIGADGRLYASTLNGRIIRWDIADDGTLTNQAIYQGLAGRPIIGLAFDPLDDGVLWVSHNDPLWPTPAKDFTGRVATVSINEANFAASTHQDYIVGLPRSVKDHLTNSLAFGPDGMLYLTQGGNTATGAADNVWGNRPERLLSAAVLRIDPRRETGLPIDVQTERYEGRDGSYDPFATNAPVQIYATGLRNAYDLVWHSNGSLYAPTNGSNAGGVTPASPDGSVPALDPVWVQPDFVYRVEEGGYYGHPNPVRGEYVLNGGNPTGAAVNGDEVLPHSTGGVDYVGYPVGTLPDPNYRGFAWRFCCNDSTNGVIEYRSDAFGGALQGKLLLVRFAKGHDIVALDVNGDGALTQRRQLMAGFERPLNLVEDVRNGNLYVAELVTQSEDGGRIQLLRAQD